MQVSILEIYNEKVQDLLIDPAARPTGGLRIREHKQLGIYVQDLGKHPVDSYEAIEEKMNISEQNKIVVILSFVATPYKLPLIDIILTLAAITGPLRAGAGWEEKLGKW